MTLIKSISGIRGTIGGKPGEGLSPLDIVKFTSAFGTWVKKNTGKDKCRIVVGRDARISGPMVDSIITYSLVGLGIDVINIGLASTPTTEIAVIDEKADGGIIITASHNPTQWNALKLLNNHGEFLNAKEGEDVLHLAENDMYNYAEVFDLGTVTNIDNYTDIHIKKVLDLELVDVDLIKKADFTVSVDAVNSVGGIAIPNLLKALGVNKVIELNCEPTGHFAHNPEPIPANLVDISKTTRDNNADLGIVVDPDVDRLALICENGEMFGEEYTLVSIADYILSNTNGNTVSNLSSTRALKDVTNKYGSEYNAAAVGEVNVVAKMKETNAVIGGEGNGGVIYPESHYGRDALVGVGLFLTLLAKSKMKCSELKKEYPQYFISKNKIELTPEINVDAILESVKSKYAKENITDIDGVKIDFVEGWVHLRKSNTEPIIRVYSESSSEKEANGLAETVINFVKSMI